MGQRHRLAYAASADDGDSFASVDTKAALD
jgi:hypothetical protein